MVGSDIDNKINEFIIQLNEEDDKLSHKGSGWQFIGILSLYFYINFANPLRPRSYIDLPKYLKLKKAIMNPQNRYDNMCFKYCMVLGININNIHDNHERISQLKKYMDTFIDAGKVDGKKITLSIPFDVNDTKNFYYAEKLNNVRLNIYDFDSSIKKSREFIQVLNITAEI